MRVPPVVIHLSLASAVVLGAVSLTLPSTPADSRAASSAIDALSAEQYLRHVSYLASDAMGGRANGSAALDTAAEYIAGRFRSWGLTPGGDGGTFFQPFELAAGAASGPKTQVRNVIAALPGRDPALRDQWVVVGAHYDHLGLGERGSLAPSQRGQIHHGADDNASGTSGVLELARLAATRTRGFRRSVLFATFAGEELGLLGSSHFANHPTVPAGAMAAMINMDMIGRPRNGRVFVGGVGTSPVLRPWLDELNRRVGLQLDYSDSGFGSSDHTSFTVKHVPVLFFFSGLHGDYHKPTDTSDKIDARGARRVLSLVYLMMERLATDPARPEWTAVAESAPSGGGGAGYGPYFGSIPDFGDAGGGVLFADVRPGSPAAKAGLRAGDLLVEFDGTPVQNLYDFTYALRAKKPGDAVRVVVRRNDMPVAATVLLEARR
ncbi:MAG: hypothetical protein A3F70_09015 [Acidobacteria bacterium RIFCSPLOWO2_12_FULL_67_14]|nr:MAG: hypothetical protein A3F70_09015 [Acidobacteria bacterium RIFCSPLOWO2_12_FULL_67_14]